MDQYTRKTSLPQRRVTLANIADPNQYLASLRQQPMSVMRQRPTTSTQYSRKVSIPNISQAGRVSKAAPEAITSKGFGRAGRSSVR
jgi:hypothetical protein